MHALLVLTLLFALGHDALLINAERVLLTQFLNGINWNERWKISGNGWSGTTTELTACNTESTPQNSWTWSYEINTTPAIAIELVITYTARDCATFSGGSFCKHEFDVYAHQSQTKYPLASIPDPSRSGASYRNVGNFSAQKLWSTRPIPSQKHNIDTLTIVLDKAKPYLYLALHYKGGCFAVSDLEVNYFRCENKALTKTLVQLPETVAPANGSVLVNGSCAQNSFPVDGVGSLHGYCQSNGEWSTEQFSGECQCEAGYQNTTTALSGAECQVCPNGTYKYNTTTKDCIRCPGNSIENPGGRSCGCVSGYFRAAKEHISKDCTAPPSAPKALRSSFTNASWVILTWLVPDDDGGRPSDVYYRIECKKCNANGTVCVAYCGGGIEPRVDTRTVAMKNLDAFTYYRFKVYARNDVSGQAEKKYILSKFAELLLRTHESVPGMPEITLIKRNSDTKVLVRWILKKPNGILMYYELTYYPAGKPSKALSIKTNATEKVVTVEAGPEYVFQVRASNRLGVGSFSKSKTVPRTAPGFPMSLVAAVAGAAAGVILILIIIICIYCVMRRRKRKFKRKMTERLTFEMDSIVLPTSGQRMYVDPSNYGDPMQALLSVATEIDKDSIKLDKLIGGGEFADVYIGTLTALDNQKEMVAVKILKPGSTHKNREDFCIEASIMGQFDHPNVIALKGVVTKTKPMMILIEIMENGSLDNFLKKNDGNLSTLQLVGMARGVAAGMTYLSEMNFIHRDLAARNILVADNLASKVSDFGLSRELDDTPDDQDSEYQTQGGKIPVRWTAPEAIRYKKFSSASDVWSYGILLWEIMSFSERPYWTWDNWQVMDRVESGYRLPMPMNCPKVIHNLMLDCWDKDKGSRPKFADIVRRLDELIRSPDKMKDELAGSLSLSRAEATNFAMLESVEQWLDEINMARYSNTFVDNGYIDLNHIRQLEEGDLERMGIKLIGHRKKISKSIKAMNDQLETGELPV